ncbi:GTP-binding protein 128up [Blattella germanica]|nr:GTP-binding protein 128up [Blattella germanica]
MSTILEKIAAIEAEMARTQKNKATAGHLGLLKARLAKLRRELITPKGGGGGTGEGFDVAKTGDARIGFVGFPSVGKSTLLSTLAGVYSEVAAYEFTTLTTVPGCIKYKGAKIQLLDLPGIIEGAKDGKGRGRQVIAVARTCSLIFIVLDVLKPLQHKKLIEHELEGFGLRLNKTPPNIVFRKKDKGGVNLQTLVPQTELDLDTVKSILSEYTKPKGQLPDYESPVVLHSERLSVEDFCNKLHRSIAKEFKYALVWGASVKHQPQKVGKDHVLHDEDVVQIVKKV